MTTAIKAARGRLRGLLCEQYRTGTPEQAKAAQKALADVELLYEAVPETPEEPPTVASLDELLVRMGPNRYIRSIERNKESGEIISVLLGWEAYSTEIGKYSQSEIVNIRRQPIVDAQPVEGDVEWEQAKWHELKADDQETGAPEGDTIRLAWKNGTVLVGRLTVPSVGAGHQQVCRMQTVFGGDTFVFPHGATLTRKVRVAQA